MASAMPGSILVSLILLASALQLAHAGNDKITEPWKLGRATFYGKDGWSIHTGSCGYYYLDEKVGTGWDVAAIADTNRDFKNSCGTCKEVRCKEMWFRDGYGQKLERETICYDPNASVVVMITDTCPCVYPGNYYSNKRWCCGDMYHLDMSLWAFEKLADTKWGVIAIEWRNVPCWYRPAKPARNPFGKRSTTERAPPQGWKSSWDKRPWKGEAPQSGRRLRGLGA